MTVSRDGLLEIVQPITQIEFSDSVLKELLMGYLRFIHDVHGDELVERLENPTQVQAVVNWFLNQPMGE